MSEWKKYPENKPENVGRLYMVAIYTQGNSNGLFSSSQYKNVVIGRWNYETKMKSKTCNGDEEHIVQQKVWSFYSVMSDDSKYQIENIIAYMPHPEFPEELIK